MEDDPDQQSNPAFHQIQMRMNEQHQYPHSHHGTPATEYTGFMWSSPQATPDMGNFGHCSPQRPSHQSLHPLVMPQWPSMLGSQSSQPPPNFYSAVMPQAQLGTISPTPLMTPISASSTRSGSTPRRTLTDEERRKMCEYHERNPGAKQNEIGSMFGVERSTVSKVLRQKDKYLRKTTEAIRSPERRIKGRSPDIEKTLSNWVIKEQRKGSLLSDEAIREKAQYFSSVSGPDSSAPNPANSETWLKNFKRRHNISSKKVSKDDLSSGDVPVTSKASNNHSSGEISPLSQRENATPSPISLRGVRSDESLKMETPEGFSDLTTTLSGNSLSGVFRETSTSSFSPNPLLSPASPFFTPESSTMSMGPPIYPPGSNGSYQRPRSQTFPLIYNDLAHSENSTGDSQYMDPNNAMDASIEDNICHSLNSIDEIMDDSSPDADLDLDLDPRQAGPQTVSPTQMMHPPPLPASAMIARSGGAPQPTSSASASAASATAPSFPMELSHLEDPPHAIRGGELPSQQEAREALKVVWTYFASRPEHANGRLDMEEIVMMGKFMEKLKARN